MSWLLKASKNLWLKILKYTLTWIERDLTDHDPTGCEMKLELDEPADPVVEFDRNVPRMFEYPVLDVAIRDGLAVIVLPTDAEHHDSFWEHLQQKVERIKSTATTKK